MPDESAQNGCLKELKDSVTFRQDRDKISPIFLELTIHSTNFKTYRYSKKKKV